MTTSTTIEASNDTIEIRDNGYKGWYSEIPRLVTRMDLSHAAFRLYCYYKDVCGPNSGGKCFKKEENIRKEIHMDGRTVRAKRQELVDKGLIKVEETLHRNGSKKLTISIVDVWQENAEFCQTGSVQNYTLDRENDDSPTCKTTRRPTYKTTRQRMQNYTSADLQNYTSNNNTNKKNISNKSNEKKSTTSRLASRDHDSESVITQELSYDGKHKDGFTKAAEVLYAGLLRKGLVNKRRSSIKNWANVIRKFIHANHPHIKRKDFEETLFWYIENIAGEYVPEAYSAQGFCDKYFPIRSAMKRAGGGGASKSEVRSSLDTFVEKINNGEY